MAIYHSSKKSYETIGNDHLSAKAVPVEVNREIGCGSTLAPDLTVIKLVKLIAGDQIRADQSRAFVLMHRLVCVMSHIDTIAITHREGKR